MPTYEITSPDGRKFRVTAPDGASQDDVLAYAQKNMPVPAATDDPGALQAGVIGAGRVIDRTMQGAKQAGIGALSQVNQWLGRDNSAQEAALADMKREQDANTAIYKRLQEQHPVATIVGEIAPLVAALPAAGTVTGAAAVSAIPGALEYGAPEERMGRAALGAAGGAIGAAAGKVLGRVIQPFRPAASESQAAAQAAADRLGVQLRPGEITQSRPLRWAESALNDLPFASGMSQAAETARRQAINQAGARSIGKTGPEITPELLAQARTDIGGVFDTLLAGRKIELGPKFRADVQQIVDSKVLPALRDDSVQAIIAPFQNMPKGKINVTGEWLQQNKTALDSAIRSAYTAGENGKAMALESFENALVGAARDSMNTTERAAWDAAQKQWASLRLLETGKVVEAGNIMPGRLDSALINRYKAAYKEGKIKGDLADIGTLAQAYKPLPQSGTAPRAFYSGIAGGMALANPLVSAATIAGPALAQKFLQSAAGRKYLTQGIADVTPELEKRLMLGGYGLLGLPAIALSN